MGRGEGGGGLAARLKSAIDDCCRSYYSCTTGSSKKHRCRLNNRILNNTEQ